MSNVLSKERKEEIKEDKKTLPPDDLSDCTKEEIEQVKAFEECLKEYKKPSKTKIEKMIDFETELDKWVWDRLPLSNAQKEELLYGIYLEDNNIKDE